MVLLWKGLTIRIHDGQDVKIVVIQHLLYEFVALVPGDELVEYILDDLGYAMNQSR